MRVQKEKEWFCDRIRECENGMYRLALGLLNSDADARDAVQEALIKAYQNLESLESRRKFRPWIMRIVKNTAYDMLRQRKETVSLEEGMEIPIEENTSQLLEKTVLWEAVQLLKIPYRTVVVLFYYEDMSVREISQITKDSPAAVKKQLSRAREQLKKILAKEVYEA